MITFFKRIMGSRKETITSLQETVEAGTTSYNFSSCKILVVCKGHAFSRSVVDYAIDMARRTRCSLVALNLDESGRSFEDFTARAKNHIGNFAERAEDAGLNFSHEIRQGNEDNIVTQMYDQDPQFRYVMDDSVCSDENRVSFPVYTRACLQVK